MNIAQKLLKARALSDQLATGLTKRLPELERIYREMGHSKDTDERLIASALAYLCGESRLRRHEMESVSMESKP